MFYPCVGRAESRAEAADEEEEELEYREEDPALVDDRVDIRREVTARRGMKLKRKCW